MSGDEDIVIQVKDKYTALSSGHLRPVRIQIVKYAIPSSSIY